MKKYIMAVFADGDVRVYEAEKDTERRLEGLKNKEPVVTNLHLSDDLEELKRFAKLIRDPKFEDRDLYIPLDLHSRRTGGSK